MARIEIKDLTEDTELDSQAMANIIGGKSQGQVMTSAASRRRFDRLNPAWLVRLTTQEPLN